jgi:hypothetical protein
MKTKCDFCKTEYNTDAALRGNVQCAVCGHQWTITEPVRKNSLLVFFAALCALLSAIVFTVVVITQHQAKNVVRGPLVTNVSEIDVVTDEAGVMRYIVRGTISNISDDIYGVPDLIIVSTDEAGRVLARQKFMPTATLLDAGATTEFNHMLSPQPSGVKKISAQLADIEPVNQDKK